MEAAAKLFARRTYDGVSIDDLVKWVGVHRNSLYGVFGSKRGLYLAALRRHVDREVRPRLALAARPDAVLTWDLLLLAAVDRAPEDSEVAGLVSSVFAELDAATGDPGVTEALLGRWLRGRPSVDVPTEDDALETAPGEEI
ncbi:TetR family transcriptional regulator [Lentzea pudingi]|uniref:TetR family transcriptional regulator n=1 Tax=Lentzea pudingi TaxID=1789439 RepID=A0ABQ2HU66_9PSEU|nr:TetR family transcriptional regulator [Lentzea pudingi]